LINDVGRTTHLIKAFPKYFNSEEPALKVICLDKSNAYSTLKVRNQSKVMLFNMFKSEPAGGPSAFSSLNSFCKRRAEIDAIPWVVVAN
jgi:hypothetical protein